MLIVFLISQKDYEPFLADAVFEFDGLGNFDFATERTEVRRQKSGDRGQKTEDRSQVTEGRRQILVNGGWDLEKR